LNLVGRVAPARRRFSSWERGGTGKELFARAIHYASPRAGQPLVKVNCAALPENLLESELFGHEKGAFTGAVARRVRPVRTGGWGIDLLDEIGDLSPALQAKLLRSCRKRRSSASGSSQTLKDRCAVDRRHQPHIWRKHPEGRLSGGFPLLPPQCGDAHPAAPEGAERGHPDSESIIF